MVCTVLARNRLHLAVERNAVNERHYASPGIRAKQLLSGEVSGAALLH